MIGTKRIQIQAPTFSESDIHAIASAAVLCEDAISKLIRLLQNVRAFRFEDLKELSPPELEDLKALSSRLGSEICLTLYHFLLQANLLEDGWLDLTKLSQQCLTRWVEE